ncbi:hypothetical protein BJX61DRAFT_147123 [Aspergillus egyptiacus]|nr:hypothetical protein BJX61DRAFT_147123 [Aspergillus egyptiacus]
MDSLRLDAIGAIQFNQPPWFIIHFFANFVDDICFLTSIITSYRRVLHAFCDRLCLSLCRVGLPGSPVIFPPIYLSIDRSILSVSRSFAPYPTTKSRAVRHLRPSVLAFLPLPHILFIRMLLGLCRILTGQQDHLKEFHFALPFYVAGPPPFATS